MPCAGSDGLTDLCGGNLIVTEEGIREGVR